MAEDAYSELITEALAGGFGPPAPGAWSAEWIVAHMVRNQEDLITVSEAVLSGDKPTYDNREAVDIAELDRYVRLYGGGMRGLADRLAETVTTLHELAKRLDEDEYAAIEVPVRIEDGGQVVLDRLVPWRSMLTIDEVRHAPMHLEQLLALRNPGPVAAPAG